MKNLQASLLLSLLAFATLARSQIALPGSVPTEQPDAYDATMIGTALGPAVPRALQRPGNEGQAYYAVQPVRVVNSRAFAPDTVVNVFLPYLNYDSRKFFANPQGPIDPTNALPIGRSVLLIAAAPPRPGVLRAPIDGTEIMEDFAYDPGNDPTPVAAFAFFDTRQAKLAPVADPRWRMLESVAAAIHLTDDANARKIADFLERVHLPEWAQSHSTWHPDDQLSQAFTDAVANERPYRRALIEYALNDVRYLGYGDRYRRDVRLSATDPKAFPDYVPDPTSWEQPGSEGGLPKGFRHDPIPSDSDTIALLKAAQSPTVATWLLRGLDKPADADVRALGRFLDSPDPQLRWTIVERLANWYGLPAPERPKGVRDAVTTKSRREYPGLDAAAAFWKAKLRTP